MRAKGLNSTKNVDNLSHIYEMELLCLLITYPCVWLETIPQMLLICYLLHNFLFIIHLAIFTCTKMQNIPLCKNSPWNIKPTSQWQSIFFITFNLLPFRGYKITKWMNIKKKLLDKPHYTQLDAWFIYLNEKRLCCWYEDKGCTYGPEFEYQFVHCCAVISFSSPKNNKSFPDSKWFCT